MPFSCSVLVVMKFSLWAFTPLCAVVLAALSGDGTAGTTISPPATVATGGDDVSPFSLAGIGLVGEDADPFLRDTRFFVDGRLRYEFGDQEGREASHALTWRHRAGIETGEWLGFSFLAELEHTWDLLGEDQYNPFPRAGRTVIADPGNMELNRLQLHYGHDWLETSMTVGRQRITLDEQRFVGNVGWRQNEQTYDAVRLKFSPWEDLTLNYAWLWRVNRIFGEQAPSAALNHFDSDSHLFNARYEGVPFGALTAFAYLLDFEEAPALSSETFGLRFNGSSSVGEGVSIHYDLQWAVQQESERNPANYTAHFYRIEGGIEVEDGAQFGLGYEVLGEDGGAAFQTPLGTNHKFNGFADAFLVTPATGLQDLYAWIGLPLPGEIKGRLSYHYFLTDTDRTKIGEEIDFTLGRKLNANTSALLKAAFLTGNGAQPDVTRVSLQLEYTF